MTLSRNEDPIGPLECLSGAAISGVHYLSPSSSGGLERLTSPVLHEVSMGVRLDLVSRPSVEFLWRMSGPCESLGIATKREPNRVDFSLTNVSSLEPWRSRLGLSVVSIGVAVHSPDHSCPKEVWSVRLGLEKGKSVVIALGENVDGRLAYIPDSLLVVFDREVAKGFRIPASTTSSWGTTVSGL